MFIDFRLDRDFKASDFLTVEGCSIFLELEFTTLLSLMSNFDFFLGFNVLKGAAAIDLLG